MPHDTPRPTPPPSDLPTRNARWALDAERDLDALDAALREDGFPARLVTDAGTLIRRARRLVLRQRENPNRDLSFDKRETGALVRVLQDVLGGDPYGDRE